MGQALLVEGQRRRTRIIMIASWLLTTSQSPSVARISRWSSLLSSSSRMSGSATTYRFSSRSPNARDTAGSGERGSSGTGSTDLNAQRR